MKKFYSISIHGEFANILYIEKKKSLYNIIGEDVIEIGELSEYVKDKHSFYIVVSLEELIDDVITVPSVVKNKQLLQSYILKKFKDSLPTKQILLNYNKIAEDKEEATVTYKVDAIAEKEYIKTLKLIPDWREIRSATIEKFALLNITRKCYASDGEHGYFSVFTHGKTITVLAIDEHNDLLFERTSTGVLGLEDSSYLNIVEEVIQTIAYVKQKFRSVEFGTLIIGGSLSLDDEMAQHLLFSTGLNIAVMYPNTFIKGLTNEEPQQYLVTLGSFLVKKSDMFLPKKVLSLREYDLISNTLMFLSSATLAASIYFAYDKYVQYSDTLERYDTIKSRLLHMIRTTDTYSFEELEKSYKHLEIAKKYLQYHPSDILFQLKPLIEMLPPSHYLFDETEEKEPKFNLRFEKEFTRLSDLYAFEKSFLEKFTVINHDKTMKYSEKTDYSKLKFIAEISSETKKTPTPHRRRRRR